MVAHKYCNRMRLFERFSNTASRLRCHANIGKTLEHIDKIPTAHHSQYDSNMIQVLGVKEAKSMQA